MTGRPIRRARLAAAAAGAGIDLAELAAEDAAMRRSRRTLREARRVLRELGPLADDVLEIGDQDDDEPAPRPVLRIPRGRLPSDAEIVAHVEALSAHRAAVEVALTIIEATAAQRRANGADGR